MSGMVSNKKILNTTLILFLVSAVHQSAFAFTPTLTPSGALVKWPGQPKFNLAGNSTNRSGMKSTDFYQAVVNGMERWAQASGGAVGFDYWQGTDRSIYTPASTYDGLSSIYFASNSTPASTGDSHLNANVLGLTQVWYNTDNGQILEADIALNDRNFYFSNNPSDTSGYGSNKTSFHNGLPSVYIENVITHEIGHAFGLSHSGGLQSTMLFM